MIQKARPAEHAPICKHMKRATTAWAFFAFLAVLVICSNCIGGIDIKASYTLGEPIVVKVTPDTMPEGAVLRKAKFKCLGAAAVKVDDSTWHIWAPPGKYAVDASGTWRLYQTITDKNDKEWQVIADEDDYEFAASFEVTGGDGPGPVPPPPPLPPPGERRAVIIEESEQRTTAQAVLFQTLTLSKKAEVLDDDQPSAQKYLPLLPTSISTVRPVMLVMAADRLVRAVPCPTSIAAVDEELKR